ncbi:GMC family oxidoreductase N-terminal domain-containing protein [Streptomyces xanthophaeus]|uniref:GMC family oxidoreductase n=1 Tax=Streptomyces xanthophaeus TaxID=67385 RepID=UPI0036944EDD
MVNRRSIDGLVRALLGEPTEPWHVAVPHRLERLLTALPAPARAGVRTAASALDAYAIARHGRRLDSLTGTELDALAAALPTGPAAAVLLDAVKVPLLLAAGTARLEHTSTARWTAPPDPPLDCIPSAHWPDRIRVEAVVVGSGAGGAVAARELARAGRSTLVIEEGRHHSTASFGDRTPLDRFTDLYRDAGAGLALGSPPVLLPTGRAVGGTTVVNAGTCYRTPGHVLTRWRDRHGLTAADPAAFAHLLDHAENLLRVARQPRDVLGGNGLTALRGALALHWQADTLRRNAPGCQGSCQCVAGCPTGSKQSVQLSVLPEACAAGARIVTSARVERVLLAREPGARRPSACGVLARRTDGSTFEVLAPLVVLAAGALQTPALLRRSGLGGHPCTGRNLSVHPATSVAGRFDDPVRSSQGVLQSVGVEEFHHEGILIEATAGPPGMTSFILPGVGRALREELDGDDHLATIGAMIADRPGGRVLGRTGRHARYELDLRDADRLRRAIREMGRLLFAAGAREVLPGIPGASAVTTEEQLTEILSTTPTSRLHLSAFHPTGTAAMGSHPASHPVDPDGRLRGAEGVLVCDASLLPTCPQVNPQLTIMALAQHVAVGAATAKG